MRQVLGLRNRVGILAAVVLAFAGCAGGSGSQAAKPRQASADEEGMVCRDEAAVGSLFTKRVCRPENDDESREKRARTQDVLRQPNARPASAPN
jgi:hypothetical protein